MLKKGLFLGVLVLACTAAWAGEYVVEVSNASASDNIYTRVGLVTAEGAVDWGISTKSGEEGRTPSVATDGGVAIMVYRGKEDDLFYQVGVVDTEAHTVAWGPKASFSKGQTPSVGLKGTRVVVAHQGTKKDVLYVLTGTLQVERRQITFGAPVQYDEAGRTPGISLGVK